MLILLVLFFLFCFLLTYLVIEVQNERKYFEKRNIHYLGNGYTLFFYHLLLKRNTIQDLLVLQDKEMKKANVRVAGTVSRGMKTIVIKDVEILRSIFIKDFENFVNRKGVQSLEHDTLLSRMLIALYDKKWKDLRSKMSPTFTTGKIKRMFSLFNDSAEKLVKYVEERMEASPEGEIDLWEGYSKFTMDTIATVVCGMDSKAFDQVEPSVFEEMGKHLQLQFGIIRLFKFIVAIKIPILAKLFKVSFIPEEAKEFFRWGVKTSIKQRAETGEKRNDFIELMLEAREGQVKVDENELDTFEKEAMLKDSLNGTIQGSSSSMSEILDDDGIVANCVLFILAGFDTTQSLLLYCAYALALYPEIQDRLREEIEKSLEETGGEFTYESLHHMTYLDMVINETLRFYPPAVLTDRECNTDYKLPGMDIIAPKKCRIMVPIMAIQHDEEYWPNPEKFDPERFSPENKHKIKSGSFLAFGMGPRNCIGLRFALTEVKLAISQLVHNFDIRPSKRTLIPMKYQNSASLKPKGGMWLSLTKRV